MNFPAWLLLIGAALALVYIWLTVFGARRWSTAMHALAARMDAGRQAPTTSRYDARELQGLPAPVQHYFRTVLKDGQPVVTAATIDLTGTLNMSPTGEQWKPFTSQQRATTRRPGFMWDAKVAMFPGMPVHVLDRYITGEGQVRAAVLGLFPVAELHGGGGIARGEFLRWLAETAWYPTALLPSQGVRWQAVDEASANATVVDGHITLTLLFRFNDAGLIVSVRAAARGSGAGKDMVMLPWECTLSDYRPQDGMLVPMAGQAAWLRPQGRHVYFKGTVTRIGFEFSP